MNITWQRPHLYPKQADAIFCSERYATIEASTKSGKTQGCAAWIVENAIFGIDGSNWWWVAPVLSQSKIVFRRIRRAIAPDLITEINKSDLYIRLLSGAYIWFKSADNPDSLYGDDVYGAVVDEASRMREESWWAIRSTLTRTRGKARIIGNVKGRKNWFYNISRMAQSGAPDMRYSKITAMDAVAAGVLAAEEIEDAKNKLPPHVFRELYLAEPSDDGGNPFGIDQIAACIRPLSTNPPKVYGADLAKSTDWTVVIGLDASGHVCRFLRFQKSWDETMKIILMEVGNRPCLVDSTGVGDPILEMMQKGRPNFEGFKFTAQSKQQLMEGLAMAFQQREIGIPEGDIKNECDTFEYEYRKSGVAYTAPAGLHDDCVCSLALAWRKLKEGGGHDGLMAYYQQKIAEMQKGAAHAVR